MRALLVEDNPVLADGVSRAFALAGLTLDHASDLSSARAFLREFRVDIVLLDLTLPDGDGMTLLGEMRDRDDKTPVLILTARDAVRDRVSGLDRGADDYLTKPFALDELMARARALWGGILLLISAAGMYYAFGFNVFTMFPICFAGLGGVLALAAGKPDEPKAHF